jgi:predicted phage terminase large subunit-like protein
MDDLSELQLRLLSSHLEFTKYFYLLKTGRPFHIPDVIGRESHYKIISRELEYIFKYPNSRLLINVPPGHGKSTLLIYFVAWAMAHYPDSQFMYISYGYELAESHTATIKEIIEMPIYQKLFNVSINRNFNSRGDFKTDKGGRVKAYGSSGAITGMDAGLPYLDRFSGMVIIDDAHKPGEVHSDTMRDAVIKNYNETIKPRPRSDNVPIAYIGQRLQEYDLAGYLLLKKDGYLWKATILKAIDEAGNALCPAIKSLEQLLIEKETNRYVFASQYQQDPIPSGDGLFREEDFLILPEEPEILKTFITCDTAETDKTYNDATVFSFWGLHKIKIYGIETEDYGLHLLDCWEVRIEPRDLEAQFFAFYADCMRYKVKPELVAIEKKSTGVTLLSTLKNIQGLRMMEIERTRASGNKAARYIEMQPYIAKKLVSLPRYAKHSKLFIDHMVKITANDAHRHDDICDTVYDAIRLTFIDKVILPKNKGQVNQFLKSLSSDFAAVQGLKDGRTW